MAEGFVNAYSPVSFQSPKTYMFRLIADSKLSPQFEYEGEWHVCLCVCVCVM